MDPVLPNEAEVPSPLEDCVAGAQKHGSLVMPDETREVNEGESSAKPVLLDENESHGITTQQEGKALKTFYPKILKLKDFLYAVRNRERYRSLSTPIHLIGTVKLHGMHADVVFESTTSNVFRLQSRNRLVVPGKENISGFASYIGSLGKEPLLDLRNRIIERHGALNPGTAIDGPIILAGEWCGKGVQKKVAVGKADKFLSIISININGQWVLDRRYADIDDEKNRIFHIGRAGFLEHDLDLDNIDNSEREIYQMVGGITQECPFASIALAEHGKGEGIVWKVAELCGDTALWFKSKGDDLAVSKVHKLPMPSIEENQPESIEEFAVAVATENRMEQGWEYLIEKNADGVESFVKWILDDCLVEKKLEIEKRKIPEPPLSEAIKAIAEKWFLEKVRRQAIPLG